MARATRQPISSGCDVAMELPIRPLWRDRLEASTGHRRDHITVSVVVGLLVFVGVGLKVRGATPSIAPPARAPIVMASTSTSAPMLFVHVAGAVRRPGLYQLPPGARIADAIEVAGGALARARLSALNLAEIVTDGYQVLVPGRAAVGTAPGAIASPASTVGTTVDLNLADQPLLETIPGIGPVTATAIIQHRTEIGSFTSIDQLLDVTGIGPATLESIRPYVSI